MTPLDGLNAAQSEATQHTTGPALITAGAGSGKTRVLTLRTQFLIEEAGVEPDRIVLLTFTRKAADEMRDRLNQAMGGLNTFGIAVGTIHSICYRILRHYWDQRQETYEILSGYPQKKLFKTLLAAPNRNNPHGLNWDLDLKLALGRISYWKNALVMPEDLDITLPDGALWRELYLRYEAAKHQAGQIDLDDMLVKTWHLLETNTGVRRHWQAQWAYVLTDEAQDSSLVQWRIIESLAAPENNLFVVGDSDQSIYAFRGGRPDYLSDFADRFPSARTIALDINYRSLPYIVTLGNHLINWNPRKIPKAVQSQRTGSVTEPTLWTPDDEDEEGLGIAQLARTLHDEGATRWRDIACIYRTNAQSQPIEDALIAAKIPYQILGGFGFWGRKEVQDLLAYLRVLEDPHDVEAYQRALFNPSRYLGKVFVSQVLEFAQRTGSDLITATRNCPAKPFQQRAAREWVNMMQAVQPITKPADRIMAIRDLADYDAWFVKQDTGDEDDTERMGNLEALVRVAGRFDTTAGLFDHVEQAQQPPRDEDQQRDQITLLTIHRAKGLEWPVVIVPGFLQGVLPHKHALSEDDPDTNPAGLQEERRLAYVAITRARDMLVLSAPVTRFGQTTEPSQFLGEMGLRVPGDDDETIILPVEARQ